MADQPITCPFCGWEAIDGEYAILLHMETFHSEGDSPFVPAEGKDNASTGATETGPGQAKSNNDEDTDYVACPVDGCGETILLDEIDFHIEMHAQEAEGDEHPDDESQEPARERERAREKPRSHSPVDEPTSRQTKAIQAWKNLLRMPSPKRRSGMSAYELLEKGKRLGVNYPIILALHDLGKYAHEDRMPDSLIEHLQKGVMVSADGVIPVLAQLLEQSPSTQQAYLCHPCVQHVSKLRKEGGFCGYRNIQTISSYMIGVRLPGAKPFNGKIPTIFQIQDFIESAWDQGISAQGREETGGIKGTRKYIGTPETRCDAQGFKHQSPGKSEALLMEDVEAYFKQDGADQSKRVRQTNMPPIYFQHAGHSMTIIGLERQKNGDKNLLVFDPMFHDTKSILKLVGKRFEHRFPDVPLKAYRRGNKYLKKYREFELLK
ncbi:DUF1671-domain-containing protein [Thozetella sp. PMI_491]|nr:DUF1671-domain-containing protein [Thozetella sp. PMI_491]